MCTCDTFSLGNLSEETKGPHIARHPRQLRLQLQPDLQQLSRRRDGRLHEPSKCSCNAVWCSCCWWDTDSRQIYTTIIILLVVAIISVIFIVVVLITNIILHTEQACDMLAALCCTRTAAVAGAFVSERCQNYDLCMQRVQ